MAGVEYDLDTSGGLMPQIQALLAPPSSDENKKQRREKDRISISYRRPGRAVNHDCCDSCKEGGDLICCDNCPAAFHLQCHDPPLDEDDLPTGEWLCHCCRIQTAEKKKCEDDVLSSNSRHSQLDSGKNSVEQNVQRVLGVESGDENGSEYDGSEGTENTRENDEDEDEIEDESPLQTLIRVATLMNPKQFQLPNELQCTTVLPGNSSARSHGCNKRLQKKEGNKTGAKRLAHELDNGIVPLPAKVCFECRKSCLKAPLIQCDFCPLLFHQDCLDPPLTTLPTGRWMCPNHAENILDQKLLSSTSLTERVKLWNRFTSGVSQDAVKVEFLKKIHRQNPPFRYKIKLPPRNRVQVPNAVKEHYRDPPKLLPRVNDPLTAELECEWQTTNSERHGECTVSPEDQETWLSNVVSLQTSIARFLMQKQMLKKSENVRSNGDGDSNDNSSRRFEDDNSVSLTPVTQQSSQGQQSTRHVTQRIINGEIHALNNNKVSTETNSRTKINSLSDSAPTTIAIDSRGSKLGNAVTKTPFLSNVVTAAQKTGRCAKVTTNKSGANKCDVDSSSARPNTSFTFETSNTPKYTLASKSTGPIATNSTYVLQVKPPSRNQTTATNNCSDVLNFSKLPSTNSVPVKREDSFEDHLVNDSTKLTHLINILQTSIEDDIEVQLSQLDEKLVHILAYQRLQQLISRQQSVAESKSSSGCVQPKKVPVLRSRAVLSPICGNGQPALMMYRVFTIGTGDGMDLPLNDYGHCNYVSARHACIFYDEMTKQFELLNYSEHGTAVDNVVYSCDFTDKNSVVSAPTSVVAAIRTIIDKYRGKSGSAPPEKLTMTSQADLTNKPCNCKASSSALCSSSGAGWEGTAVLHHGSFLRFGCLHFVFSVTETATREALMAANKPEALLQVKNDVPQMMAMCSSASKPLNTRES